MPEALKVIIAFRLVFESHNSIYPFNIQSKKRCSYKLVINATGGVGNVGKRIAYLET